MDWKVLDIEDKDLFNRHFRARPSNLSDYTFTNLFIWHYSRTIRYALAKGFLCIEVTYRGRQPLALMPISAEPTDGGALRSVLEALRDDFHARKVALRLRAIGADMRRYLEHAWPDAFNFQADPDHFDYVYSVHDLIELSGREFHDKRNHLNRFNVSYDHRYAPITTDLIDAVAGAQIRWCQQADCDERPGLADEHTGILEALNHFTCLDVRGGAILVDDRVVAFTLGEVLTADTAVIHIEKADAAVRGAYQAINQQFLAHEFAHMTHVNREEDLGLPGLRRAKQSYNPVTMIEKFIAAEKT